MIKHSVLLISFNQKDYIDFSINSVLNQTELPFEIIILDDESTDGTWDIIKKYQQANPDIIKAFRNEVNLGLFKNLSKMRQLYNGNVVSLCAGDDFLEPNTIKAVNDKIRSENLDADNEKFIVITNSVHLYPDGTKTIWNNYRERNISAIKTRLRYGLSYRGIGLSKELMKAVKPEEEYWKLNAAIGLNADFFKGFDEIIKADRLLYVDDAGGGYRLDVGVTSNEKTTKKWINHQAAYRGVKEAFKIYFDKKDFLFIDFILSADQYKIEPSFYNWMRVCWLYIRNLGNFSYNNPAIRNLHYLLPSKQVEWLKFKAYPYFLKLRR